MLEQKEVKQNVIEELDDIDNKGTVKNKKAIKPTFVDTFKASLIDLIVIGAVSTVGVFVVDAILRLAGYAINQKFQMTFVIFMVVMVLYMSIMESGKMSATIGKKVSGLFITKR